MTFYKSTFALIDPLSERERLQVLIDSKKLHEKSSAPARTHKYVLSFNQLIELNSVKLTFIATSARLTFYTTLQTT